MLRLHRVEKNSFFLKKKNNPLVFFVFFCFLKNKTRFVLFFEENGKTPF